MSDKLDTPNSKNCYEVHPDDVPVHCPVPGSSLWDSHPRVYVPLHNGEGKCPYCGAVYKIV